MHSRAARCAEVQHRLSRAVCELLESRRLLSVTNQIEAINSDNVNATPDVPADPSGAVGPTQVVNVVNSAIEWYSKAGVQQNSEALYTFFSPLGTLSDSNVYNPKVQYDQYAQRFVVVALQQADISNAVQSNANTSQILIAISDDSDPNGTWYFQAINAKTRIDNLDSYADYLNLAVGENAVYLTANMFPFSNETVTATDPVTGLPVDLSPGSTQGQGTRLWIVPKSPLYSGALADIRVFDPVTQLGLPSDTLTLQPAQTFGTLPAGVGTFLVTAADNNANGDNQIQIIEVISPLGNTSFQTQTIDVGKISTGEYHSSPEPWGPIISPFESFPKLGVIDDRIFSAVWRNDQLYATQEVIPPVGSPDAGQLTAHWYRINTANLVFTPAFNANSSLNLTATAAAGGDQGDQGNVGGDDIIVGSNALPTAGVSTFNPSVMVDSLGDMAVGFTAVGPSLFPDFGFNSGVVSNPDTDPLYAGGYVTARLFSDPAGTTRTPIPLAVGQDLYAIQTNQINQNNFFDFTAQFDFGEYSSVALDPTDEKIFWAYNQYTLSSIDPSGLQTQGRWGTRWGSFTAALFDLPAVGNFVFDDLNGDGIWDTDAEGKPEPGMVGVTFRLYDSNNNLLQTTTSDNNGSWYFQGLPTGPLTPGQYYIEEDISQLIADPFLGTSTYTFEGYAFSPVNVPNGTPATDSDFTPTSPTSYIARSPVITLNAGNNPTDITNFNENIDAGLYKPFASIAPPSAPIVEGNAGSTDAVFTVTLSNAYGPITSDPWNVNLFYSTVSESANGDADFAAKNFELLTIPAGQNTGQISIPVYGDTVPETNEFFAVSLFLPSQTSGLTTTTNTDDDSSIDGDSPTAVDPSVFGDNAQFKTGVPTTVQAEILDDDSTTVSVDSPGNVFAPGVGSSTYALFNVRLAQITNVPVTVQYNTVDGTAHAGQNYIAAVGSLTFTPGQLAKTVRIKVLGDSAGNPNLTFSLVLSTPTGAKLGSPSQALATIVSLPVQTIDFGGTTIASYIDSMGNHVSISLQGPGAGSVVTVTGGDARELVLDNTTEQSTLTIRTTRGQTSFSDIQINGGLASLMGKSANLLGNLTATTAIKKLNLNYMSGGQITLGPSTSPTTTINLNFKRLADVDLTSDTNIQQLNIGSWIDTGVPDVLSAPYIAMVRASADFQASISTSSLPMITVGGVLGGSTISTTGSIGTITAGAISKSTISSGTTIKSISVRRGPFSDSSIIASVITSLDLNKISNDTGAELTLATADKILSAKFIFDNKAFHLMDMDQPGPRDLGGDMQFLLT